jgi:hypothetical protein
MGKLSLRRTSAIERVRTLDALLFGRDVAQPKETHLWWFLFDGTRVVGYCGLGVFEEDGGA